MGVLYGIEHSNRKDDEHWSKNRFNSSFPTALACYMLDHNIPAIYAKLGKKKGTNELQIVLDKIYMQDVFMCKSPTELQFNFESKFPPYKQYVTDTLPSTDLVVSTMDGDSLIPLEIKLTTLPSESTRNKPKDKWGCEIVFRYPTTSYCAIGLWNKCKNKKKDIQEIFEKECENIEDWNNQTEMLGKIPGLCKLLDDFESRFLSKQTPIVMQPFWKTAGRYLDHDAFDVVIWSDMAFSRLFIETAKTGVENNEKISRPMRATARMARSLWELSTKGKINIDLIYRKMTYGAQNDKETMLAATQWRNYINSPRVTHPSLTIDVVAEIFSTDAFDYLKPERRLDQTLYLMKELKKSSKPLL